MTERLRLLFDALVGAPDSVQRHIVASALLVVAVVLVRRLVLFLVFRRVPDVRVRYRWSKVSGYVAFAVAILGVGWVWFEGLRRIWTFLGLVGAGLAIALRDLVADLAGWAFILWRDPFEVGDRIQVGEHHGDVVDIRIFQFTLLETGNWVKADQSTGRILHVPNQKVLTETVANYTRGFPYVWHEIPVLVTFESDWRKAKAILREVVEAHAEPVSGEMERRVKEASRRFLIFYSNLAPTLYTTVEESGVLLTLRYLSNVRKRRGTEEEIWEAILDRFGAEDDIDFAYPTWRVFDNPRAGKEGTRPPGAPRGSSPGGAPGAPAPGSPSG